MRIVDLSHVIRSGMPVYPGTEPPVIEPGNSIERDGFAEKRITMVSHTGTHIDAPAHILDNGPTLDRLAPEHFIGPAAVVPAGGDPLGRITVAHLAPFRDRLKDARFVILRTGWSAHWGETAYFHGYPVLEAEATRWLARLNLFGLGIDAISIDPVDSTDLPNHRIVLERGCCIVENLTNLEAVGDTEFTFVCLPLKFADADGSPVRAVALMPDADAVP